MPPRDVAAEPTPLRIARLISDFLGPSAPRRDPVGATLTALLLRLQADTPYFANNPDQLAWQMREALRTEFFKVIYPTPPPRLLLGLVTNAELVLADPPPRTTPPPFYFPGARVAVPTDTGSRRAATSLQIRYKTLNNTAIVEVLLHLDGPNGGGFQWVQAPALSPLPTSLAQPAAPTTSPASTARKPSPNASSSAPAAAPTPAAVPVSTTTTQPPAQVAARPAQSVQPAQSTQLAQNAQHARQAQHIQQAQLAQQAQRAQLAQAQLAQAQLAHHAQQAQLAQLTQSAQPAQQVHAPAAQMTLGMRRGQSRPRKRDRPNRPRGARRGRGASRATEAMRRASTPTGLPGLIVGGSTPSAAGGGNVQKPTVPTRSAVLPVVVQQPSPQPPPPPPEPAAVSVPRAIAVTSPPPRNRILGDSVRPISHANGALRRALDAPEVNSATVAARVRSMLIVERLMARRRLFVEDDSKGVIQYYVKWSGLSVRDGSWEAREALLEDIPALVAEFDTKHPQEPVVVRIENEENNEVEGHSKGDFNLGGRSSMPELSLSATPVNAANEKQNEKRDISSMEQGSQKEEDKIETAEADATKQSKQDKEYVDDLTGISIPAWVDTPILELSVKGMVVQFRRPNEWALHPDAATASRDTKKRQARFKHERVSDGAQLFALSKTEARHVIESGLRRRREQNQFPIPFPRGLGVVSPGDHGEPFSRTDVKLGPASWDAYFTQLGLTCTDFNRDLPPCMPTLDEGGIARLQRVRDDLALLRSTEHRERARRVIREVFRLNGSGAAPPTWLFRNEVREPPGKTENFEDGPSRKRIKAGPAPDDAGAARTTSSLLDPLVEEAVRLARKNIGKGRGEGAWYDAVWNCWRSPSSAS